MYTLEQKQLAIETFLALKSTRKTIRYLGRKFSTFSTPLFLCIHFYEFLINIRPDQRNCLFLKVFRDKIFERNTSLIRHILKCNFFLFFDFSFCLFWSGNTPHFFKCVHIKRQRIEFAIVISHRTINVTIKRGKLVHILPNLFVIGMENMRTVFIHIYTINILGINISGYMITFFNY